jgi:biotin transport system substrate-specific component
MNHKNNEDTSMDQNAPDSGDAALMAPEHIRSMVYTALMAAFIAIGAFVAIPIGPVPIVLQNLFVLLAGLLLGPRWGAASVALYLLAGACGLPVFAGATGGLGRFLGPTGGYLISYLPAVMLVGGLSLAGRGRWWVDMIALVAASLLVYAIGVPWLQWVTGMPLAKAIAVGMAPFIVGDVLKVAAALAIAKALRPVMNSLRPPSGQPQWTS